MERPGQFMWVVEDNEKKIHPHNGHRSESRTPEEKMTFASVFVYRYSMYGVHRNI